MRAAFQTIMFLSVIMLVLPALATSAARSDDSTEPGRSLVDQVDRLHDVSVVYNCHYCVC